MPGVRMNVCSLQITQAWPASGDSRIPRRNCLIETLDPERQQLHATYRAIGKILRCCM